MNVTWLTHVPAVRGRLGQGEKNALTHMASYRLRVQIPVDHLSVAGVTAQAVSLGAPPIPSTDSTRLNTDILIMGKFSTMNRQEFDETARSYSQYLKRNIENRTPIIVDYCDDILSFDDYRSSFYRFLFDSATAITVNTNEMARRVSGYSDKPIHVVSDPVEGTRRPAVFTPGERLSLFWYGHASNLPALLRLLPSLSEYGRKRPTTLYFSTRLQNSQLASLKAILPPHCHTDFAIKFKPYVSQDTVFATFRTTDLVIIPADPDNPKTTASHNRLTEALWAGRFVLAHPIPSYREFTGAAWLGEDITQGIEWALAHDALVVERIGSAQEQIAADFHPARIGARWKAVLDVVQNGA